MRIKNLTNAVNIMVLLVFALCHPASAFNSNGHRLIALIAYEVLESDEVSRPQIDAIIEILKAHPRFDQDFKDRMPSEIRNGSEATRNRWLLSQAGVWPDMVRSGAGKDFHRARWHYVNYPTFAKASHSQEMDGLPEIETEPTSDLDAKNYNIIQAIKNSTRIVSDQTLPNSLRAVHLCWLVHLVADSHQPLHAAAIFSPRTFPRGDQGGNKIPVTPGQKLHKVWDARLGKGKTFNRLRRDSIEILGDSDLNDCGNDCVIVMSPDQWVNESWELAVSDVYTAAIRNGVIKADKNNQKKLQKIKLTENYFINANRVSKQRAVSAGFRLAALLEEISGH